MQLMFPFLFLYFFLFLFLCFSFLFLFFFFSFSFLFLFFFSFLFLPQFSFRGHLSFFIEIRKKWRGGMLLVVLFWECLREFCVKWARVDKEDHYFSEKKEKEKKDKEKTTKENFQFSQQQQQQQKMCSRREQKEDDVERVCKFEFVDIVIEGDAVYLGDLTGLKLLFPPLFFFFSFLFLFFSCLTLSSTPATPTTKNCIKDVRNMATKSPSKGGIIEYSSLLMVLC